MQLLWFIFTPSVKIATKKHSAEDTALNKKSRICLICLFIRALPPTRFPLMVSHEHRLYLHPHLWGIPLRAPIACALLPSGIVVEPSPVRGLAADCPIHMIFKPSHFGIFHPYVVVHVALRGFQQFNMFYQSCYHENDLSIKPCHRASDRTKFCP